MKTAEEVRSMYNVVGETLQKIEDHIVSEAKKGKRHCYWITCTQFKSWNVKDAIIEEIIAAGYNVDTNIVGKRCDVRISWADDEKTSDERWKEIFDYGAKAMPLATKSKEENTIQS